MIIDIPFKGRGTTSEELVIHMGECFYFSWQARWTDATPDDADVDAADVDEDTDTFAIPAHGMLRGLKVQVSSDDTLPTGLAATTDYYVVPVDENSIAFAASYQDAMDGTVMNLQDEGVGTHTVEVSTLSATNKLQESVDGVTWTDIASSTTAITTDSTAMKKGSSECPLIKQVVTVTGGQITYQSRFYAKKG